MVIGSPKVGKTTVIRGLTNFNKSPVMIKEVFQINDEMRD